MAVGFGLAAFRQRQPGELGQRLDCFFKGTAGGEHLEGEDVATLVALAEVPPDVLGGVDAQRLVVDRLVLGAPGLAELVAPLHYVDDGQRSLELLQKAVGKAHSCFFLDCGFNKCCRHFVQKRSIAAIAFG